MDMKETLYETAQVQASHKEIAMQIPSTECQ